MDLLKLVALDKDDLEVVSAHLQDSEVKAGEILWRPAEKRVVIGLDRFDWEKASGQAPTYQRRRAALRFERVMACKAKAMAPDDRNGTHNLLAVEFTERDGPAGTVRLMFEDGGVLRLEVECLEAELADLGPVRDCDGCPDHSDVKPG